MDKADVIEILNKIEISIREIEKNDFEFLSRMYSYQKFNKLFNKRIEEEQYNELRKDLNSTELNELVEKIKDIEANLKKDKEELNKSWDGYNENYKEYVYNKYSYILIGISENDFYRKKYYDFKYYINEYLKFYKNIMNIYTGEDPIKFFSVPNKNYVIFGKNGAGKTKLLNHVKDNCFKNNSFVVPSNRNIEFGRQDDIKQNYKQEKNLVNIFDMESLWSIYPNDYLCQMIKDLDYKELQQNKACNNENLNISIGETKNKVIKTFNSLSLERKITFNEEENLLELYNSEQRVNEYSIKDGSDGEKTIIQFIMFILLCPKNSFVFIDEPETHLNTALLNELFNLLENERKDLIFIYCTHDIDFIESRINCELVYLNKFDGEKWDIKMQDSFDNIPIDIIISIIGTKKDILFIESEENKIDYKFYSTLFPQYKIIPVNSCERVIQNCKSVNQNKIFNRKAIGIIDNDYREKEEIDKLSKQNIFVLKYNEIENLLMAEPILKVIYSNVLNCEDKIKKTKEEVIKVANKNKETIIQDYINKVFFRIQTIEKIKYAYEKDKLEESIDIVNERNKKKLIKKVEIFSENLNLYIEEKQYEEIIRNVSSKEFISEVKVAKINKETYINMVIARIKEDENFRNMIKNNYFEEIK